MKRKPVIIAILTLLGISSYFLWASSSVREGLDPENDFANWQPTAALLRKSLPEGTPAVRAQAFALLFQQRFRKHEPGKAVGVHIMPDGRIHLLTPARLEPWNVDRIALMLHQEAQTDLDKNYDIDIYETFIGTPPIKIGELRPSAQTPSLLTVRYRYPDVGIVSRKHPVQGFVPRSIQGVRMRPAVAPAFTISPRPKPPL